MHKKALAKLLLIAAAWSAAPSVVRAQDNTAIPSDIPQLTQILNDEITSQDLKDQTAEKLASRSSRESIQAIHDALLNYKVSNAQTAAAKALTVYPSNDPSLIDPLFMLLGGNGIKQSTVDAAAMALTAYKTDPTVLDRLISKAREGTDEKVRVAAIRAMGTFVEKRAAGVLIELINPSKNPPNINTAAEQALAYMTGQRTDTVDAVQLQAWWNDIQEKSKSQDKAKSDLDFVIEVYKTRSGKYDQIQRQLDDLQKDISVVLNRQYSAAGTNQDKLLLQYLNSDQYYFRAIGAQIVQQSAKDNAAVSPAIRDQIRNLISDSSPIVREEAANAIAAINDANSIELILAQLNQEPDSNVQAALLKALGPIQDIRVVQPLLRFLNDTSHLQTLQAAATSLSDSGLGTMIRSKDPKLADEVAEKLVVVLRKFNSPLNNIELRKSISKSLVQLASKSVGHHLQALIDNRAEIPAVKRNLIEALAALQDPEYEDTIASCINDDEEVSVKVTAIKAYGRIAQKFSQVEKKLSSLIDPQSKQPQDVRDAAWDAMKILLQHATDDELDRKAQKFDATKDYIKRIYVLQIISEKARLAGNTTFLWKTQQQIGDTAALAGAEDPQYYQLAITSLQAALQGAENDSNKFGANANIPTICDSLTESFLHAKKYSEAIKFVEVQIAKNPDFRSLGTLIRKAIESLKNETHEYDDSLKLINLALGMNPQLKDSDIAYLNTLKDQVQAQMRKQNSRPRIFDIPLNAQAF